MKIFILGSCVTRDAFHSKNNEGFILEGYQARYSLARISLAGLSPPIELIESNLSSLFQQNMLKNEIANTIVDDLKNANFDYLIIDCIDERFGLIDYLGTYVTYSVELKKSKIIDSKHVKMITPQDEKFYSLWELGLLEIIKVVDPQKIIINNVYWAEKNNHSDRFPLDKKILENNSVLQQLYGITGKYINGSNFINYPKDILVADVEHKWGIAPYHYTTDVYNYLKSYLKNL